MVRALRRKKREGQLERSFATAEIQEMLDVLGFASVILGPGNRIDYFSPSAAALGVIRDEKLVGDEFLSLLRKARRTKLPQDAQIEMPRGPIGEGTRKLSVNVHYLADYDSVIATFTDESEAERIDAVRRDFVANISHE